MVSLRFALTYLGLCSMVMQHQQAENTIDMRNSSFDVKMFIESEILDVAGIAQMYGRDRRTIELWLEKDPPPFIRLGNKRVYIKSLLREWRTPKLRAKRG